MSRVALSEFCEIKAGGRRKWSGKHFVEDGYPAFGAGGLNGFLPDAEFDQPAVVLSAIGARCGKCFIAEGRWSSLANTQLIFPDPDKADPRFLWYQLNDERRWPRSGTGQPFIKASDVKSHEVYLPPIEQQRRAAAVLDRGNELRAARREALEKLDALTRSVFVDLFGNLDDGKMSWPVVELDELITDHQLGLVRGTKDLDPANPHPYVRMDAISDGEVDLSDVKRANASADELKKYSLEPGDLLFNTRNSRELVGKTGIFRGNGQYLFNNNLLRLRFRDCVRPEFINAALRTPLLQDGLDRRKSGTTSVFAIYYKSLKTLPIPLPPTSLQVVFEERIRGVRQHAEVSSRSATKIETLFASLREWAFQGEL